MGNAIIPLFKENINKIDCLIKALKRIERNKGSSETRDILNQVEKYLQEWLNNKDTLEYLEQEEITSLKSPFNLLEEVVKKTVDVVQERADEDTKKTKVIFKINDYKLKQKKELIVLGYFLQGELQDYPEEIKYIKKVLRSYLATIEQFRSSPRSQ
ncbi:hypothetical protein NIES267_75390 (plasmid) [Calothrix parasitica NIES-267]|uniref:Uncharacterized protein n=1 Tax=Calothrix parasitica NIES-267 TaxID=1973488 RepID=A0A1Z4M3E7_9CYAN|nr:hypothetical protein NIES267_75390 [Calothrix parasitica NIES-267]